MTNPLHDAAMAAKRFHDAALAYLDRPEEEDLNLVATKYMLDLCLERLDEAMDLDIRA